MPLYLGLDCSTQSLTAIVIDVDADRREVVFESSLQFDNALPQYGTKHGVLPHDDPSVAYSSPAMWTDALDIMLARVAASGLDVSRLAAIAGSAQQHGSVYVGSGGLARPPFRLSRAVAPIWMDCSTSLECAEIAAAVGGNEVLASRTGSRGVPSCWWRTSRLLSGLRSKPTTVCPALRMRSAMLPPMRPSPIMPSSTRCLLAVRVVSALILPRSQPASRTGINK